MTAQYAPEIVKDLELMVRTSLPEWGFSKTANLKLMNLSENATYGVSEPSSGKTAVIRVQREGYSSISEIKPELAWVSALTDDDVVNTAKPIPTITGEAVVEMESPVTGAKRLAVAFTRLAGSEPKAADNLCYWFKEIGAFTAKMHLHARNWKKPEYFQRKRWDFEGMMGPNAYWGKWQEAQALTMDDKACIAQALTIIKTRLAKYGTDDDVFGLVHADLRMANLLIDQDKIQVLDFDDMGLSWYLYDFASSLSFIDDTAEAPLLLDAWVSGYQKHCFLTKEQILLLPTFAMLRRILLTAWITSHAEIPFAPKEGYCFCKKTAELALDYLDNEYLQSPLICKLTKFTQIPSELKEVA